MSIVMRFIKIGALLLSMAFSQPVLAENILESSVQQDLYNAETKGSESLTFVRNPMTQKIPDYSEVWLDGRVSFRGGELTTSERQFEYAKAHEIPFMDSEVEYQRNVRSGYFVLLSHPDITISARRKYVLPQTANFIYRVAHQFRKAGCNRLHINGAGRLTTERPKNGSVHSVHPVGMALDLKVINLSKNCHTILWNILHEYEAGQEADSTRELHPEHFHVVVIPELVPVKLATNP